MAFLAGLFSGGAAPSFVEREPWERGFAQIFAREIAPALAGLERRRRLSLVAVGLIAALAVMAIILAAKARLNLAHLSAIVAFLAGGLVASRFKAREERFFFPAACQQFGSIQVEIAPSGATLAALDPYLQHGLIAKPDPRSTGIKLTVGELFSGERRHIAFSLVGIEVTRNSGIIGLGETLFLGDVLELSLSDPDAERAYPPWHPASTNLADGGPANKSRNLATPQVLEALSSMRKAFVAESMPVAVSDNRFYIAIPSSKQGRRIARIGLWAPVYRCEPAIRAVLAQLAAVLQLVDAVADACEQLTAEFARAGSSPSVTTPAAMGLPPAAHALETLGAAPQPRRLALRVPVVPVIGAAAVVVAFLLVALFVQHQNAQAVAEIRQAAEGGDAAAQNRLGIMYWNGRGVAQDDSEALRWFRKAADQGYADALDNIGVSYERGLGVAPDYVEAMRWFRRAAEQNYPDAETNIGNLYWSGRGVPQDTVEAMRWYRKAADQGYAPAQTFIGNLFVAGKDVAQDYGEAMRWYRKAADQHWSAAEAEIGSMYANGRGVTRDYGEAMRWYSTAADHGNASAQNSIGQLYWSGLGVTQSDFVAMQWYRKAAERGYAKAQNNVANLYRSGRGVALNYREAMRWYRMAADQGNADAQYGIGWLYFAGLGVTRDYGEAMRWYRKAADQGDAASENQIGWLYWHGLGVARDCREALRWYRMAADQGNAVAQNNIGSIYREGGVGVTRDYGEAMRWHRLAADHGDASAQNNIGLLYQNGWGVAQDYGEALRWYHMAADQGLARAQYHIGDLYANGWGVTLDPGEARAWMQKAAAGGEPDAKKWLATR